MGFWGFGVLGFWRIFDIRNHCAAVAACVAIDQTELVR